MTNLRPVRRADKNGKLVTRHVRDTPSLRNKVNLPPPVQTLGNNPQRAALVEKVREAMVRGTHGFVGLYPVARVYDAMDQLSDATVSAYTQEIEMNPTHGIDELLIGVLNLNLNDHEARFMLEIAKFDKIGSSWPDTKGRRLFEVSRQVHLGLGCYARIGYEAPDAITDMECPEMVEALALVNLTLNIYNHAPDENITGEMVGRGVAMKLVNDDLARLALDHPSDVGRIAAAVIGRKESNIEVIREMLATEAANLQEGVL